MLEGEAEALVGDETYSVKTGDFLGYRAAGEAHSIKNTGDGISKCIVVGQRLDHDVADYPELKKKMYRNKGQNGTCSISRILLSRKVGKRRSKKDSVNE